MLSLTPRLKEPQRARRSTVRTFESENAILFQKKVCHLFLTSVHSVLSDNAESDANNSLKYIPGKARSHHLQMMLSKDELEEEQRSVKKTFYNKANFIHGLDSVIYSII